MWRLEGGERRRWDGARRAAAAGRRRSETAYAARDRETSPREKQTWIEERGVPPLSGVEGLCFFVAKKFLVWI
jgi:hypothetical protein